MNNCLCLGLFLVVVYIQNLAWEYTSETIVTIATTALVGIMAWSRRDFPTYMPLIGERRAALAGREALLSL